MKKGVVVVLVLLAVVVLVSPAIVGRLAEQSMDKNLNWAANESGEVAVTSEQFTRGWFSSEGQHRIELREGDLLTALQTMTGPMSADELPVLIINTRLDHGLIPVSSMSREKGSLAPGLGSAVSTLQVEMPGGEIIDVPGTIYSKVALGGELHSNYILAAGSRTDDDVTSSWGDVDIDVTTNPASGVVEFEGTVGTLSFGSEGRSMALNGLTFEGLQQPTEFGLAVGNFEFQLDDLAVDQGGGEGGTLKKMAVKAASSIDDGDVTVNATVNMTMQDLPQLGEMSMDVVLSLAGADAASLGRVQKGLEDAAGAANPQALYVSVEDDLKQLFASGFDFNFEQLDFTLPQGTVRSKILLSFADSDPATFAWTSLLLGTEASMNLSIPAAVIETYGQGNPQAAMAIGSGYLARQGDDYVMQAELRKGLLTVNGAPIPIPLGTR